MTKCRTSYATRAPEKYALRGFGFSPHQISYFLISGEFLVFKEYLDVENEID